MYSNENFHHRFYDVYQCYSPAFLTDHEGNNIENGGKILLPQTVLEQLIDHAGIMLFKLRNVKNDRITHCGVLEFVQTDEPVCYLPRWMMNYLLLEDGDEIHIESVGSLPPATFARFQPQSKDFLELTNPKAVLEKVLRNFSCLTEGDLITINYLDRNYELAVLELKPSKVVSIIECDMEVDFAPSIDSLPTTTTTTDQQVFINPTTFIRFHQEETRINGKDEKSTQEITSIRGFPNYNYKYGLLQFPREPFYSINDNINEISDKNSSNVFQPFTGEGKNLRQPRNQRPQ